MTISGILGSDGTEGGAALLTTPSGTRFELLPPPGWSLDRRGRLRDVDGVAQAGPGDRVTLRGEPATNMRSIRQAGPIFRISELVAVGR